MTKRSLLLVALGAVLGTGIGFAAAAASYQKTGTVKEATGDSFVLDLGKEQWRFYTDAGTAGKDGMKVGDKVTVTYKQVATKIEVKGAKAEPKKDEKKAEPKKDSKKKAA